MQAFRLSTQAKLYHLWLPKFNKPHRNLTFPNRFSFTARIFRVKWAIIVLKSISKTFGLSQEEEKMCEKMYRTEKREHVEGHIRTERAQLPEKGQSLRFQCL